MVNSLVNISAANHEDNVVPFVGAYLLVVGRKSAY